MSFKFDGAGDKLVGTLNALVPATDFAIWVMLYQVNHPVDVDSIVQVGTDGTIFNSVELRTSATDDVYAARVATGTVGSTAIANSPATVIDNTWTPVVAEFVSATNRTVRVGTYSNNGISTTNRVLTDIKDIAVGRTLLDGDALGATTPNETKIAELCLFTGAIPSQSETEQFMVSRRLPSSITFGSAVLRVYISMATNSLLNTGSDADGDLTAEGNAAFDAAHPTMSAAGLVRRLSGRLGGRLKGRLG